MAAPTLEDLLADVEDTKDACIAAKIEADTAVAAVVAAQVIADTKTQAHTVAMSERNVAVDRLVAALVDIKV